MYTEQNVNKLKLNPPISVSEYRRITRIGGLGISTYNSRG